MEFLTALLKSMPGAVGQGLIWGIMAIGFDTTLEKKYNADLCQQLGLTMPEGYVPIGG